MCTSVRTTYLSILGNPRLIPVVLILNGANDGSVLVSKRSLLARGYTAFHAVLYTGNLGKLVAAALPWHRHMVIGREEVDLPIKYEGFLDA